MSRRLTGAFALALSCTLVAVAARAGEVKKIDKPDGEPLPAALIRNQLQIAKRGGTTQGLRIYDVTDFEDKSLIGPKGNNVVDLRTASQGGMIIRWKAYGSQNDLTVKNEVLAIRYNKRDPVQKRWYPDQEMQEGYEGLGEDIVRVMSTTTPIAGAEKNTFMTFWYGRDGTKAKRLLMAGARGLFYLEVTAEVQEWKVPVQTSGPRRLRVARPHAALYGQKVPRRRPAHGGKSKDPDPDPLNKEHEAKTYYDPLQRTGFALPTKAAETRAMVLETTAAQCKAALKEKLAFMLFYGHGYDGGITFYVEPGDRKFDPAHMQELAISQQAAIRKYPESEIVWFTADDFLDDVHVVIIVGCEAGDKFIPGLVRLGVDVGVGFNRDVWGEEHGDFLHALSDGLFGKGDKRTGEMAIKLAATGAAKTAATRAGQKKRSSKYGHGTPLHKALVVEPAPGIDPDKEKLLPARYGNYAN